MTLKLCLGIDVQHFQHKFILLYWNNKVAKEYILFLGKFHEALNSLRKEHNGCHTQESL